MTLGGLVEAAGPDRLPAILDLALDSARWCATDPVCLEHNGACRHCLLVPETSCEAFNRGLDRAVVHGAPDLPAWQPAP